MRTWVPAAFLVVILSCLLPPVPALIKRKLRGRPTLLFSVPIILVSIFCLAAWRVGAFSLPVLLLMAGYTLLPTVLIFLQGADAGSATWLDLIAILALWLPIELNAGSRWIPLRAQGFLHMLAYGVALILALVLFLAFRGLKGMKYNLPTRVMDLIDPLIAFVLVAPILIGLGLAISFLPWFHLTSQWPFTRLAKTFGIIFAATALPEELLFRSLIQNWMMQKFGSSTGVLIAASIVFGCAHLNNGPQALPNWRYMVLATIAGYAYGKVFQRASSATASMILHALVDTVKHVFF